MLSLFLVSPPPQLSPIIIVAKMSHSCFKLSIPYCPLCLHDSDLFGSLLVTLALIFTNLFSQPQSKLSIPAKKIHMASTDCLSLPSAHTPLQPSCQSRPPDSHLADSSELFPSMGCSHISYQTMFFLCIHLFSKCLCTVCCVPGILLGIRDPKSLPSGSSTVLWGTQTSK